MNIKRGQVWYADLSPVVGSEQGGNRPCLVIQNNVGNKHAPTTIVAIITSRHTKAKLPTHYWLEQGEGGLRCESMVECEQIRVIDKSRLRSLLGEVKTESMREVDKCLRISLGI